MPTRIATDSQWKAFVYSELTMARAALAIYLLFYVGSPRAFDVL